MGASTLQQVLNTINAANFSFDTTLVEMDAGGARLKDLIPAGGTFHSKFEETEATWGSGVLTGTLSDGATVSGGVLNLPTTNGSRIDFAGAGNMPSGNTGCVRFEFTPNYSGSATSYLFSSSVSSGDISNLVRIAQLGTLIRWDIYDSAGVAAKTVQTGNGFNPVVGTKYEIELNWDCDAGEYRLFINGALINGLQTSAPATLGARGTLRLGANYTSPTSQPGCNGAIDNVVVYSAVQHTADYTPFQTIPYQYSKDAPVIYPNSGVETDGLDGLELEDADFTAPANTAIRFLQNVNGADKGWDGDSWETITSSLDDSNDLDTVNDNKADLDLSAGVTLKEGIVLVSENGKSTPEITKLTVNYNFYNTQSQPETCTVWGFVRDSSGIGVSGVTVTAQPDKDSQTDYREAGDAMIGKAVTAVTDANGRFEFDLIRSSQFEGSLGTYVLTAVGNGVNLRQINDDDDKITFTVPDSTNINITGQITAASA